MKSGETERQRRAGPVLTNRPDKDHRRSVVRRVKGVTPWPKRLASKQANGRALEPWGLTRPLSLGEEERERERERASERDRRTDGRTDGQTDGDRQTGGQTDGLTGGQRGTTCVRACRVRHS